MKEKNKLKIVVNIAYAAIFMLVIVFVIYMCCAEHISIYQTRPIYQCETLENYTKTTVEDSTAPIGIRKVYNFKLSEITPTKDCLAFYIVHNYAEVRIDDKLVYSLTVNENNRIASSPSSNWVFIPLDAADSGKAVEVTLTPVYKGVANREFEFMIGDRLDILLKCLKTDLVQILLAVLCIFIGIVIMIIHPYYVLRKKTSSWEMFYLGNFFLLLGVWRITDTRFSPILFSEYSMPIGYITIAALFICSVPIMLFYGEHLTGRKKTVVLITAFTGCLVTLIALICQVFQIAELRETLSLCHAMLFVCMAVILLASVGRGKIESRKFELHGLVILLPLGAIIDLLYFYLKNTSSGTIFTIFALLMYTAIRFVSEIFYINRKVHIDALTGLFNRNKWNDLIENSAPISESTGVMMLDLNRLKYVNDNMGHNMGDKMIIDFANILRETLSNDCMIFRWGGDEFTVLISDAYRDKMDNYISEIQAEVEAHNLSEESPKIYFAVGYALSTDYPTFSREELMKKADEKMYHNKSEWYHQNIPDYHL